MTSTITARLDLPRGHVEVHTEGTAAECYAVLAGLDIVAQALGIDRADHTDRAERVTDLAGTAERAPVVETAPVDERPVTYTVDPPKAKRKAATPKAKRPTTAGAGTASGCAAAILTGLADEGPFTGSGRELGDLYGTGTPGARQVSVGELVRRGDIAKTGPRGNATHTITAQGLARIGRTGDAPAPAPTARPEPARAPLAPVEDLEPDDDVDDLAWAAEAL